MHLQFWLTDAKIGHFPSDEEKSFEAEVVCGESEHPRPMFGQAGKGNDLESAPFHWIGHEWRLTLPHSKASPLVMLGVLTRTLLILVHTREQTA